MRYENRQPAEGINVTKVNPFIQFLKLIVAATIFFVLLIFALKFTGGYLAQRVPFAYEKQLSDAIDLDLSSADASPEMIAYLNDLADRLTPGMELTDGVSVQVHYDDENVFNAFATLGGNLLFYRALLQKMPHENALAMVMAHEIAHVNHRDAMASLGGGMAVIAASFATGSSGLAERYLNTTSSLAALEFTRKMESAADTAALSAVYSLYGHVQGADALFEVMDAEVGDNELVPDWLERFTVTHPLSTDRIESIHELTEQNGWIDSGELTPLPEGFMGWLGGL